MRYEDSEIDTIIERNTHQWRKPDGKWMNSREAGWGLTDPYGKVKPHLCEHCECIMTVTGKLPPVKDVASWFHWRGWLSEDEPIQKIRALHDSQYGHICESCHEMWNEISEEEEGEQ